MIRKIILFLVVLLALVTFVAADMKHNYDRDRDDCRQRGHEWDDKGHRCNKYNLGYRKSFCNSRGGYWDDKKEECQYHKKDGRH
ncbi:hypothetical protein BKA69DRAFT_1071396 [Paraphysoderma sedebokerense]|nr:hypothetical protein BKA69DRAFT_1071396 [Paraphysoderma sedebokerense]